MAADLIDGKLVSGEMRERLAQEIAAWVAAGHQTPGLATVLVGDDSGSAAYVASKRRACVAVGIADLHQHLPADTSQSQLAETIAKLNADPAVSGILLQLPVPAPLDGPALVERISLEKDVDGLTANSVGHLAQAAPGLRACTPAGILELLDYYKVPIAGAHAVVVGRSQLVGAPVAQLLLHRDATVTIAHSQSRDLAQLCAQADILVVAAGKPGLIGAEFVKPGAVVIDVGNTYADDAIVGDVDFEAVRPIARLITPVPGGVGPMTITMLLVNTFEAARMQAGANE